MGNVVSLTEHRIKKAGNSEVTLNYNAMTSKIACGLLSMDELLAAVASKDTRLFFNGKIIELDINDVMNEIKARD